MTRFKDPSRQKKAGREAGREEDSGGGWGTGDRGVK